VKILLYGKWNSQYSDKGHRDPVWLSRVQWQTNIRILRDNLYQTRTLIQTTALYLPHGTRLNAVRKCICFMLTPLKRGRDFEVAAEEQRGLIEEEVEATSIGLHCISQQWKNGRIKQVGQIVTQCVYSCARPSTKIHSYSRLNYYNLMLHNWCQNISLMYLAPKWRTHKDLTLCFLPV
jgi:hypothetical protein